MRFDDRKVDYGWISIALHWIAGIIVMVMLVVGSQIPDSSGSDREWLLNLHTSIGIIAYPLLWARIVWRGSKGHPGPLPSQSRVFHAVGRVTHYVMLTGMGLMLISGPVTAWASGHSITLLGHAVVAGGNFNNDAFMPASLVHHGVGIALMVLVLAHIVAAIKHMAYDRDGTIEKILIPGAGPLAKVQAQENSGDTLADA